ncbi:Asd/ArgC dimerization domain-containing protein [Chloroflexota bacterium]
MNVGMINVTGYAGVELARLPSNHPDAKLVAVTGRSAAGQKLGQVFPHLSDIDLTIEAELDRSVDVAFSALPYVASAEAVTPLVLGGVRVVEISADLRIKDPQEYERWYKTTHPAPELLEESVYRLTELRRMNPGWQPSLTFVPHLIPMTRGIFATCYMWARDSALALGKKAQEELTELYRSFYKGEPFVKVVEAPPQTKQTWGNNDCLVYPVVDDRTGRLVVLSCIDNLVKGATGQAIQNMNLMFCLPETAGLEGLAVYP